MIGSILLYNRALLIYAQGMNLCEANQFNKVQLDTE